MRYRYVLITSLVLASGILACSGLRSVTSAGSGEAPIVDNPNEQVVQATAPPTTAPVEDPAQVDNDAEPTADSGMREVGSGPVDIRLELVAEGFTAPVALAVANDGTNNLYIADQNGNIDKIAPDGTDLGRFLDVDDLIVNLNPGYDERGLLGLAFHPEYADNGRFFVYYSAPSNAGNHIGRVSEFQAVDGDGDIDSERIVLEVSQPYANHNGGQLSFGPDGYLYLGLGDGGSAGDPDANGQDITTLLGGIVRIDVDSAVPYAIPADNPFANAGGAAELYAFGMRNPYRFSFDSLTGDLWVADVGQNVYEEVNIVQTGGNYGWPIREAASCYNDGNRNAPLSSCASTGSDGSALLDPVLQYDHGVGISVIGGYVYRGEQIDTLYGRYLFGDWNGIMFVGTPADSQWSWDFVTIDGNVGVGGQILGFGEDETGELYVLTSERPSPTGDTGKVWRVAP